MHSYLVSQLTKPKVTGPECRRERGSSCMETVVEIRCSWTGESPKKKLSGAHLVASLEFKHRSFLIAILETLTFDLLLGRPPYYGVAFCPTQFRTSS